MNELTHNTPGGRKPRTGHTIRGHLGTCLLCRTGCWDGDDLVRGRGRWLGLLHKHCADKIRETKP